MTATPEHSSRGATVTRRLSTVLLILSLLLYPITILAVNLYAPEMQTGDYFTNTDPASDAARVISYVALPAAILIKSTIAAKEVTSLVLVLIAVLSIPLLGEYFAIINEILR
jgi:hypothetical protein